MPTSIAIALLVPSSILKSTPAMYPNSKPAALWSITAIKTESPEEAIFSAFPPTTAVTIIMIAVTEISGTTFILFLR